MDGNNDNLVERVHQPTFGTPGGKSQRPAPPPSKPTKVEKSPATSRPAPAPKKG